MVLLQGARGGRTDGQKGRGRGGRQMQTRGGGIGKGGSRGLATSRGTRGRRGGRGSGRGGRNRNDKPSKPKSKEDLDRELDAYVLGDAKSAQAKLNGDLDEYFAQKEKKASDKPASEKAADEPAAAS